MRQKISIFILFLALFEFSNGQTGNFSSYIANGSDSTERVKNTIIRSYKEYAVAYIEKANHHYFTISNQVSRVTAPNLELKRAEIDTSYHVKDFKIYDNYVYCCGVQNGNGFIGFCNIKDLLFEDRFEFYTYSNFVDTNSTPDDHYVTKLFRLDAYQDNGTFNIVAVGTTINRSQNTKKDCILKVETSIGVVSMTYSVAEPEFCKEKFNDIIVTDNYVVTVGSFDNLVAFRQMERSNFFSANDTALFIFPTHEDDPNFYVFEEIDDVFITKISGDTIATVAYWHPSPAANIGTNMQGVLLRIYRLVYINGLHYPIMISSISIDQSYHTGNWKLKEFQYNNTLKIFTLLQDTEINQNSLESLLSVVDFDSNPIVRSEYYSDIELLSLGNVSNSYFCFLNGYDRQNINKYTMVSNRLKRNNPSTTTCGIFQSGNVTMKNLDGAIGNRCVLNTYANSVQFLGQTVSIITTEKLINKCVR